MVRGVDDGDTDGGSTISSLLSLLLGTRSSTGRRRIASEIGSLFSVPVVPRLPVPRSERVPFLGALKGGSGDEIRRTRRTRPPRATLRLVLLDGAVLRPATAAAASSIGAAGSGSF
jgi:hypothetical protein